MYSGEVSVTEEQLVPLVQAAKTLGIKGLVDVPVQDRVKSGERKEAASPPSPPPPVRRQNVKQRPSPASRPGETELRPTITANTEADQEEGVDPSGSEIDQSVSHITAASLAPSFIKIFPAITTEAHQRDDGHSLSIQRRRKPESDPESGAGSDTNLLL